MQGWLKQARQTVTDKLHRFEGRDISKFCRAYEQAMEDNGIQNWEAVDGFHLIVVPKLKAQIAKIQAHQGAEWQYFKKALKEEYFLEDSQRVTKQSFMKWIKQRNKGLSARELLREFEKRNIPPIQLYWDSHTLRLYVWKLRSSIAKDTKEVSRKQVPRGFSRSAVIKREYDGTKEEKFLHRKTFSGGFLGLTSEGSLSYKKFNDLPKWEMQYVTGIQSDLQGSNVLELDEVISGILEEVSYVDMMFELDEINQNMLQSGKDTVKVHSMEVYEMLLELKPGFEEMIEVQVETKYKTVAKKVKPMATPLPKGSNEVIKEASRL
ncbi:hypothetical protein L7F22_000475 [Adiantum nelumboides]|nr:hypothetical protein [Adiantum nelumboides]